MDTTQMALDGAAVADTAAAGTALAFKFGGTDLKLTKVSGYELVQAGRPRFGPHRAFFLSSVTQCGRTVVGWLTRGTAASGGSWRARLDSNQRPQD